MYFFLKNLMFGHFDAKVSEIGHQDRAKSS